MTDIALCALLSGGFVGSVYAWPKERQFARRCVRDLKAASGDEVHCVVRDAPSTIRRRAVSFVGATGASMLLLEHLLRRQPSDCRPLWGSSLLRHAVCPEGTISQSLALVAKTGVATLLLFSGPLVEGARFPRWSATDPVIFLRNYVLAPVGEEIFFRALLLHLLRRRSAATSIAVSSVLFALCHSHHIFSMAAEEYRSASELGEPEAESRVYWKRALERLAGVFGCTLAYGLLSGYYYTTVCAKNLLATILSHALCNMLGAPPLRFLCEGPAQQRLARAAVYVAGAVAWAVLLSKRARR
ncbi:CAAX prenyl protease 2 [Trypanosoma conorhini]|uniref:intramembrane prenyl-peptidase Rce1 n=1 Tax=Trypanosoma conorhini TaxID=83891 RepID=A0A3R7NP65_9TRYP|nr:CAAX prenyl protease 2 [Trypanosoma conorhini]RNF24894.1 CAAX prenyl protease 2 [Trypanosoma conorhini]